MFSFITKKPLWANIAAFLVLVVAVLFLFVISLNLITKHGKSRNVPDVTGKSLEEARKLLRAGGFDLEIVDSIYIDTIPPLSVIRQVPEGDAVVKIDRTVYITINRAVPPVIEMPNLIGFSFRSAEMQLKNMGLRVGDTTTKPDFAKNSVLEQLVNGQAIKPGAKIQMGTEIDLVLGDGVGDTQYPVPYLLGLTYSQAKADLESRGISILVVQAAGVTDTLNAYIFDQNPKRMDDEGKVQRIRPGQMMDVWLMVEKPVIDTATNLNPIN